MIFARLMTKVQAKHIILMASVAAICFTGLGFFGAAAPAHALTPTQAVANCKQDFFGLEPWYQYLGTELNPDGSCSFKCFNVFDQGSGVGEPKNTCGQTKSDIPLILLAVIDDLLRIAGLAAVAFVIYGAYEYVGSQGNSEVTAKAQSMILNALVGLAIATVAVVVVNFIGNNLGT